MLACNTSQKRGILKSRISHRPRRQSGLVNFKRKGRSMDVGSVSMTVGVLLYKEMKIRIKK